MARLAFAELLRVAEAQLDAARRVDGARLQALTETRRQLQEDLDVEALFSLPEEERAEVRQLAQRLKAVDARTRACGESVMHVVASILPDAAPPAYSRRGQLRGV
jgi:hypothetical protein